MMYEKEFLLNEINKIRDEIGHDKKLAMIKSIFTLKKFILMKIPMNYGL